MHQLKAIYCVQLFKEGERWQEVGGPISNNLTIQQFLPSLPPSTQPIHYTLSHTIHHSVTYALHLFSQQECYLLVHSPAPTILDTSSDSKWAHPPLPLITRLSSPTILHPFLSSNNPAEPVLSWTTSLISPSLYHLLPTYAISICLWYILLLPSPSLAITLIHQVLCFSTLTFC